MADQNAVPPAAPSAQPASAGKPAPKKRRRWPWIILGVFVLFLIAIALAPTILSSGLGRGIVLGQVNKQLNGAAHIDSWSLGWFSGFKITGISVADAQGQPVAEVQSISLPATIPALLSSHKNIGTLDIEGPKATIVLYADGTNNLSKLVKPSPQKPPEPPKPPQPLGFDLTGDIVVHHGEISVQPAGAAKPVLLRDLNVEIKIESLLEKPILLDLKAALGEERAPLTVNATASAFHAGMVDPNAVEAKVTVTLDALDAAPFAALAKQFGSPVNAAGKLTVKKLEAQVHGANSVQAAGDISLSQLALSGGPLGKDQPKFDRVGLTFDVSKTGDTIKIADFSFDSPVATAKASGSIEAPAGKQPKGTITASARVMLAALAAQLPDTLKLQKGLAIQSGAVALDSTVVADEKGQRVDAALRIEDLAATRDGQRITLDKPIALSVKAAKTDQGVQLDKLELTSSFASIQGSGTMEKFDLAITSDIEAALREAGKFVDLAGKRGQGQATVALHVSGPAQQKSITGDVTLSNLALTGFTPGPVSLAEVKVNLAAQALLDDKNALKSISGLKVSLEAPFASGTLFWADSIALAPGQPLPALRNGKVDLYVDLGGVAQFANGAGLMPKDVGMSGKLNFAAGIATDKGAVTITPAIKLTDLLVTQGKKNLTEPKIAITGTIEANPTTRTAKISDLACEIAAGKVAVKSLEVPDWAKAPAGVNATLAGDLDVAKLLVTLKDFAALPPETKVAAQVSFNLKATAPANAQTVNLQAALDVLKLIVTQAKGPTIEEEKLSVSAVAAIASSTQTVALDSLAVKSSFFNLTAHGSLADWAKAKNLTLDGTKAFDFNKIGPLVAAFSGQPIQMSGKDSTPFHLALPLGAQGTGALLRGAIASAGLHIDLIKLMGIATEAFDLALKVQDSIAAATITGQVNGGKLNLPAKVDASKDTPELTLPPNTMILSEAKITDELADQALSKVLFIFNGCAGATGSVSVDSKSLDVPLGADALQKASFDGGLAFKGVTMKTAGGLQSIINALGMADAAGRQFPSLPDQRVTVSLHNGRAVQGPMQIALGQLTTLKISGSVGLKDKTLDMTAEAPVTLALVGGNKDVYSYVKDQTLRVAITGTTDKPEYSVAEGLQDLVKAAAKKAAQDQAGKLLNQGLKNFLK